MYARLACNKKQCDTIGERELVHPACAPLGRYTRTSNPFNSFLPLIVMMGRSATFPNFNFDSPGMSATTSSLIGTVAPSSVMPYRRYAARAADANVRPVRPVVTGISWI